MRPADFSLSSISIKHRLPLLIGFLLLGIITASTWASYQGVKETAHTAGSERLQNLAQQLASMSQQSAAILLTKTATAAGEPAIRSFLQNPSPAARAAATSVLDQFSTARDPASLQVDLWDANRRLLLTEPEGLSPQPFDLEAEFAQSSQTPFRAAGALRVLGDFVVSPSVVAVKDATGSPLGYLVRWRRVSASPEPKQLRDLLGSEVSLYYGNTAGDVWTDLVKPVPKPPTDLASTLSITHYMRNGESMMAAGRPVIGTPFFLIIEFPDRVVMGQAGHFLRRVLVIDAGLLAIGLLAAFALSRSITRPLNLLTAAASGISEGSYSGVVRIQRKDELGALGNAFNAMVVRLRGSQEDVEQEIHERKQAEAALLKTNHRLEGALAGLQTKTEELASMTQQLWQASKLATLGELAASVAHELNNPLATISLRLEALAIELGDDATKTLPVEIVSDEVERMGRLVGSLLEFSRRSHQQMSTIYASEEVQKSVALIEYYLRSHKVVVIEDFEPNLPTIQADRQQLRQVFLNLLTNASDAMSGGGKLIARTRRVRLRNGARGVCIEFADAGSGISQKDFEKIWEPFFTTKPEGKGTGLGLAICRRVIEEHQGEISIKSQPGEGTTVSVCLPATTSYGESADREHLNRELLAETARLGAR